MPATAFAAPVITPVPRSRWLTPAGISLFGQQRGPRPTETTVHDARRSGWAQAARAAMLAVDAHATSVGVRGAAVEECMTDLLADLRVLADRLGISFDDMLAASERTAALEAGQQVTAVRAEFFVTV